MFGAPITSANYAAGSAPSDAPAQPLRDPEPDVRREGERAHLPLIFQIPGLSDVAAINAHARVQLKLVEVQEGMLPVAVPDLRFTYVFATFVNEVTGAVLGTVQLERGGTSGNDQLWITPAGIPVAVNSAHVGVRLRLVGGTDPNAACGQLYTECYDLGSSNGVVHIRGGPPVRPRRSDTRGSCPDPVFRTRTLRPRTAAGVSRLSRPRRDSSLTGTDVTAQVWASVDGAGTYQLTPGGTAGLVTWTAGSGLPFAGEGPHTVTLNWSWEQTSGTWNGLTCNDRNNNPCKAEGTFGPVQRAFVAGPALRPAEGVQVFESGFSSGSNSFQTGTTPTLGVSIAVTGSLKVQSEASDPVVELRVTGSQNQSIDCDPAIPNLADEIEQGCGPAYKINPGLACPAYNELWSLPEPWECVKTQTGGAVGQVDAG